MYQKQLRHQVVNSVAQVSGWSMAEVEASFELLGHFSSLKLISVKNHRPELAQRSTHPAQSI